MDPAALASSPAALAAAGVALLVVAALLLLLLLLARRGAASRGGVGATPTTGTSRLRDTVVLVGPPDAGKTVLLHQIMRGRTPATVMSLVEGSLRGKPVRSAADSPSGTPALTLVDLPGHPQLKRCVRAGGRGGGGDGCGCE